MSKSEAGVLNLECLRSLAFASATGVLASPFDPHPYIVVDLTGSGTASATDAEALAAWLHTQPCPVIGMVGAGSAPVLQEACDLVLDRPDELDLVVANILYAPLAAMSLVQVLRVTARLPVAHALVVESFAFATLQAGPEFAAWSRANPPAHGAAPAEDGPAVLIVREGDRLDITLNRPRNRNPMSVEMRDGLVEALQLVLADDTIRHATVSGAGACFSTGGDLREFGTAPDPAWAHAVRSMRLPAGILAHCADRVSFHLHSACIGAGIELPAFASRVTAARNAFFQLPEIRFGLIPGAGGCVSLARRIGRQRTAWLALSARRISVATALDWGLIDAIVG